jgi:hypothetical protein
LNEILFVLSVCSLCMCDHRLHKEERINLLEAGTMTEDWRPPSLDHAVRGNS